MVGRPCSVGIQLAFFLTFVLIPAFSVGVKRPGSKTVTFVISLRLNGVVHRYTHAPLLCCFRRCRMAGNVTTASTNGSDIGGPADKELTWHSVSLVVLLCVLIAVTVVSAGEGKEMKVKLG